MFYAYILLSKKSNIFYYGSTHDIIKRVNKHNAGESRSTKPHLPWELVWYGAFKTKTESEDFEKYLKTGSGKAFAYKRLVAYALAYNLPYRILKKQDSIP